MLQTPSWHWLRPRRLFSSGWCVGLAAAVLALAADPAAAQPATWYAERPGPYLLAAVGGTQYEYDCRSSYYYYDDCAYERAGTGKIGLGFRFARNIGVEGVWTDYGRARIDNGRVPRDSLRLQSLGVNAVFSIAFSPGSEGLLRAGLADVRHSRSDDTGGAQHVFTGTVGLGLLLHLGPNIALEVAWDAASGDGRNTGTTVASAVTAGLRWSF
jgi:hypothetical protein